MTAFLDISGTLGWDGLGLGVWGGFGWGQQSTVKQDDPKTILDNYVIQDSEIINDATVMGG